MLVNKRDNVLNYKGKAKLTQNQTRNNKEQTLESNKVVNITIKSSKNLQS